VSFLDTIRSEITRGFRGKLRTCTLRREKSTGLDEAGDPLPTSTQTWQFDGMRDSFSAQYAAAAGIPISDVRILIIAGSLATVPQIDDKIEVEGEWFQVRTLTGVDPATATFTLAGFRIAAP